MSTLATPPQSSDNHRRKKDGIRIFDCCYLLLVLKGGGEAEHELYLPAWNCNVVVAAAAAAVAVAAAAAVAAVKEDEDLCECVSLFVSLSLPPRRCFMRTGCAFSEEKEEEEAAEATGNFANKFYSCWLSGAWCT